MLFKYVVESYDAAWEFVQIMCGTDDKSMRCCGELIRCRHKPTIRQLLWGRDIPTNS